MRSDSQPKTMKNGVPISSDEADQRIGRQVVDLERDGEEEQGVELPRVPHHALPGRGTQQRQQHVLVVGVLQEAVGQRRLGAATFRLHALEHRQFIELEPDVDGEGQQDQRDQERNAPRPLGEGLGVDPDAAGADDQQGQEEAQRCRGLDPARGIAAAAVGRMLGNVGRGTAVFAAEGQALQQAQGDEQNWCQPADCRVGRQQTDREGGAAHNHDGYEEGVFAADEIAEAAEDQCAEGADQEARGVGGEGRQQRCGIVTRGEEQRRKERRQRCVEIEIVPFENRAQGRRENDFSLFRLRHDLTAANTQCGCCGCHLRSSSPKIAHVALRRLCRIGCPGSSLGRSWYFRRQGRIRSICDRQDSHNHGITTGAVR